MDAEKILARTVLLSIVFKSLCDLSISLPFILWKFASPKQMVPQKKGKHECA
jgi:hypothetical protein